MKYCLLLIEFILFCWTDIPAQKLPSFQVHLQPSPPDYSLPEHWSALPFREDAADHLPAGETWIDDNQKSVDVFYIYPTLYMKGKTWNADIQNKKLNQRIDRFPVKYQASVFNRSARVFAPRYRQAIIQSFYDTTGNGKLALDFAYEDVKQAFKFYLNQYNQGRPIIIASHSQGTYHARRLLKDFFDIDSLKKRLVCAYTIGFQMRKNDFSVLTPCTDATQTGCYITWSTFREGYEPPVNSKLIGDVCINPLSWRIDTLPAEGRGSILLNLKKKKPFKTKAKIHKSYLWVKTSTPIIQTWNNLHLVDINLFWHDIRKNIEDRIKQWYQKHP
ncbi:MAG: DUF3089 domain-containing protein [Flavobacteriales bacterium]|nr:DUF3089 domain-containing protein [Flavobacteriales bacterium]